MSCKYLRPLSRIGLAALATLAVGSQAMAQTAPDLVSETSSAVVSSTFTNSNTATQTIINGDDCFTTGPVTVPVTTTGTTQTPCSASKGTDQGNTLAFLNSQSCTSLGAGAVALNAVTVGGNPPGTFPPGCYSSGGAMNITLSTTVTLSGSGVYIFRPGGALTTGQDSVVTTTNGACIGNVFWAPIAATTLGANTSASLATPTFIGTIVDAAGISIGHFANLGGRALAFGGTVTTDANTITVPAACSGTTVPTLPTGFLIGLSLLLAAVGAVALRSRVTSSAE
jgi:hypothetical protein